MHIPFSMGNTNTQHVLSNTSRIFSARFCIENGFWMNATP